MGNVFLDNFNTEIKFEIWMVIFLKSVLQLRNYWMDFRFSGNNGNIVDKALDTRSSLMDTKAVVYLISVWLS